jgi:hypothetical protein
MAVHEIPAGEVSAPNVKLTAATVEEFKFAEYVPVVEIITDGAAEAFVTIDGSTPTVGGSNCYVMPPLACVRFIAENGYRTEQPVVKVISSGTPSITVSRADPRSTLVAL